MRVIGIIPARMASTRFPGKPLALIAGRPMLQHVWGAARRAKGLEAVSVATDSPAIIKACGEWGAKVVWTSPLCRNGTERVNEAAALLRLQDDDLVINIQGDEPLIHPDALDALARAFIPGVELASLYFKPADSSFISDRHRVKVLVSASGDAVSFNRSVHQAHLWCAYGQHVGVYAYRRDVLAKLARLPVNPSLEQGAWMDAGYKIRMVETAWETAAVDSPQDIAKVEKLLSAVS